MSIFTKKKEEEKKGKVAKGASKIKDAEKDSGSMKDLYGKEDKKTLPSAKEVAKKERKYGNAYKILIQPLVTEKASIQGAENKYFFEVAVKANKIEIMKAIKEVYGVKPISINIIKMKGKKVRHGKHFGKKSDWKKAVVTLSKGESIKIYEGV